MKRIFSLLALHNHYGDVIMGTIASQITSLTIVYSTDYSDADQRKYQSSASLAFVRGFHLGPVNSPHKWPVTRKMSPFDDVIMITRTNASIMSISTIKNTTAFIPHPASASFQNATDKCVQYTSSIFPVHGTCGDTCISCWFLHTMLAYLLCSRYFSVASTLNFCPGIDK